MISPIIVDFPQPDGADIMINFPGVIFLDFFGYTQLGKAQAATSH